MYLGIVYNKLNSSNVQFWLEHLSQSTFVASYSAAIRQSGILENSVVKVNNQQELILELRPAYAKLILSTQTELTYLNKPLAFHTPRLIYCHNGLADDNLAMLAWQAYLAQLYELQKVNTLKPNLLFSAAKYVAHKEGYRELILTQKGFMAVKGHKNPQIQPDKKLDFLAYLYDLKGYLKKSYSEIEDCTILGLPKLTVLATSSG
jgi:hypothetical protein